MDNDVTDDNCVYLISLKYQDNETETELSNGASFVTYSPLNQKFVTVNNPILTVSVQGA